MTTGMGQLERGANRIYGILRDRPTVSKYSRALLMALIAGFPALCGYAMLIAAFTFSEAVESEFGIDDDTVLSLALPLALTLLLYSITMMLRFGPRRRQPGWSWLALGALVAVALWLVFTAMMALYLNLSFSDRLGYVYGPLTGVVALLLWSMLSSVAIFVGLAISAQIEAQCAGQRHGALADPESDVPPSGAELSVAQSVSSQCFATQHSDCNTGQQRPEQIECQVRNGVGVSHPDVGTGECPDEPLVELPQHAHRDSDHGDLKDDVRN